MEVRLDILLVQKNIAPSREKAKEIIKAGQVFINGKVFLKPSQLVDEKSDIDFKGETQKYVGRGGLKLEKAIDFFEIALHNKVCADIGASTGGFTDCMLQNGANIVYAVDVGHDQLAEKLKQDPRVINLEGVNVRYISNEQIPDKLDFISIDVSFISLRLIIPKLKEFLKDNGEVVALIKPQFEAGKSEIGKKGVVKSQKAHISVLNNLISFFEGNNLKVKGIICSPIKGSEGNIEYLVYLKNQMTLGTFLANFDTKDFISKAFNNL